MLPMPTWLGLNDLLAFPPHSESARKISVLVPAVTEWNQHTEGSAEAGDVAVRMWWLSGQTGETAVGKGPQERQEDRA